MEMSRLSDTGEIKGKGGERKREEKGPGIYMTA
jgi:hypothetical protein